MNEKTVSGVRRYGKLASLWGKLVLALQDSRYLYSIRQGFTLSMPVMLIGAIAVLINNFPLFGYQGLMERIFGGDWRRFGSLIYSGTFSVVSLVVSLAISYELAQWYRQNKDMDVHPLLAQIASFSSVMVLINYVEGELDLTAMTGVNGLFLTIVITILATELFIRLTGLYVRFTANIYANEASTSVPAAMNAIVPFFVTVGLFVLIRIVFHLMGINNINAGLNALMQRPFENMENTPVTAMIFSFVTHFLWIFGIHGNNVLDNVARNIYLPAIDANIAAHAAGLTAPHMYTKTFFDAYVYMGGSGATICLILALLLFCRRSGVKRLARISLPMGIFNINEPLTYGLPIVLNPVYIVPFLLTPLVFTLTTSAAMALGLVPFTVAHLEWTTPIFASGYAASGGSISGMLLQAFNLILGVAIYAPFVRLSDRLEQRRFKTALSHVYHHAINASIEPQTKLLGMMGSEGVAARQLANDLNALLQSSTTSSQLYLVFQPLVDTKEGRVFGYETLLRWDHPMHGPIPPPVIISLAEDMGKIEALGLWILDTGFAQLARFREKGLTDLVHFTNLSVRQLSVPGFRNNVAQLLKKHGIPPEYVQLEITESAVLSLNDTVQENIASLNELGVHIALDDFGMGHSSLSYLEIFPSKTIKIEESLTENMDGGGAKLSMIRSIVTLAQSLNIEIIAEHVETQSQLKKLQSVGCTKIQGFLFSRPLLPDAFEAYVKTADIPAMDTPAAKEQE